MRRNIWLLPMIALMLNASLGLACGASQRMDIPEPTSTPFVVKVWVALQHIPRGSELSEGMVGLREWPSANVPPDAIRDLSETREYVTAVDLVAGQIIVQRMLIHPEAVPSATSSR